MKGFQAIRLLVVMFLFCPLFLQAEVYTIDFNRGTRSGTSVNTNVTNAGVTPEDFCHSGARYVNLHANTLGSYYDNIGCGIRIGADNKNGQFILTLNSDDAVYVTKIIVYASKVEGNSVSRLTIKGGSVFEKSIENDALSAYSSSFPKSGSYILPEIDINMSFKNLQVCAPKGGYVMLHRIDIIFSEDILPLPAMNGEIHYATFSSDKASFFPEGDAIVSKVSVNDGRLNVTALESQDGFGTSGYYVPANTGVLVASASSSATYYTLDGETLNALEGNMLKPASEAMTGSYKFYKLAYDDYANETGLGFYWGAENGGAFSCKAGTAYLAVPNGGGSVKGFILEGVSDEDSIESLTSDFSSRKGETYNAAGQHISRPSQGFYIRDGRKFVGR